MTDHDTYVHLSESPKGVKRRAETSPFLSDTYLELGGLYS